MEKEKRAALREGTLANFRFFLDELAEKLYEGITTNISSDGFGFLTEVAIKEGQMLTIAEHYLPDFVGLKMTVLWVKKRPRYFEAGAELVSERRKSE